MKALEKYLNDHAEVDYRQFQEKLLPGVQNILGVRKGCLRNYVKNLSREEKEKLLNECLSLEVFPSHESALIAAILIGQEKEPTRAFNAIRLFAKRVNNWDTCDALCTDFKIAKKEPEATIELIEALTRSDRTYEIRIGVVLLLKYFAQSPEYLRFLDALKARDYYVQMALAWCYAEFACFNLEETLEKMMARHPSLKLKQMTCQKIKDSFRINEAQTQKAIEIIGPLR